MNYEETRYRFYRELEDDVDSILNIIIDSINKLVDEHTKVYSSLPDNVKEYIDEIRDVCRYLVEDEYSMLLNPLDKLTVILALLSPIKIRDVINNPQIHALGYILRFMDPSMRSVFMDKLESLLKYLESLSNTYSQIMDYIKNLEIIKIISLGYHPIEYIGQNTTLCVKLGESKKKYYVVKILNREDSKVKDKIIDFDVLRIFLNIDIEEVPQIILIDEFHDKVIIIREYIEGTPLNEAQSKYLKKRDKLLDLGIKISDILGKVYSKYNIIHRDLRLANIIVDPEKNKVYIIDWIYASKLDEKTPVTTMPLCNRLFKELFEDEEVDNRTMAIYNEICCLSMILWELYNGLRFTTDTSLHQFIKDPVNRFLVNVLSGSKECVKEIINSKNPFKTYRDLLINLREGTLVKKHPCLT